MQCCSTLMLYTITICHTGGTVWKRLYKDSAYNNAGTLAQLQSLIKQFNVPKKPKRNVSAAEDFLQVSITMVLLVFDTSRNLRLL